MRCRNPYFAPGGSVYGCGQCTPCRVNTARMWQHRMMLECTQHDVNSFWTLTYDDAHVPQTNGGLLNLVPRHLTIFLKRLRKDYQPLKLRYFGVGEYGTKTERPHYHLALFNYPHCERGVSSPNRAGYCCSICERVKGVWGSGQVFGGKLEDDSATYLCGYITKSLTKAEDSRLAGRHPEFSRKSLKPGIGAGFIPEVASTLIEHGLDDLPDVPTALRHGGKIRPLGRYLTRKLREQIGKEPGAPESVLSQIQEELQPLREMAKKIAPSGLYRETLKTLILDLNEGRYRQLEARQRLYKKRESI